METINHQGYDFVIWDISGKEKIVNTLSVINCNLYLFATLPSDECGSITTRAQMV